MPSVEHLLRFIAFCNLGFLEYRAILSRKLYQEQKHQKYELIRECLMAIQDKASILLDLSKDLIHLVSVLPEM